MKSSGNPFMEVQLSPKEAIRDYLATHKSGIGHMKRGEFEIRTLDQAEKLSTMLASHYPAPDRVSAGIWELLSNGIEHGNLEIDFEEKSKFMRSGLYNEEIERRLILPRYSGRVLSVDFRWMRKTIRLRVTDEGPGFDFSKYMKSQHSLDGPNGRGILIAMKFSFDKVIYRGRGNVVDAIIRI